MSSSAPHSKAARLGRCPFALAVTAVYALSFVSQALLSAPVTARMSVVPFLVVQIVLIWIWIVLHMRRLRDAGRPTGIVIGVALVYLLEVVPLALLTWILTSGSNSSDFAGSTAGVFHLFALLYLLGTLSGDPHLGVLQIWLMVFAAVMFLPTVIAIIFSIWAATRASAPASP